jgi:hypothetical protein|tara:strand:+ start:465 stop:1001 length:537 start_codon:yes stop_codon:yes gene_type:complete
MAKISNTTVYPNIVPTAEDFVVLTDVSDSDATKTCTIDSLQGYFGTKTLVRTLTDKEIVLLFSQPTVLLTCALGEFISVISSQMKYNYNGISYTFNDPLELKMGDVTSTNNQAAVITSFIFNQPTTGVAEFRGYAVTYPDYNGANSLIAYSASTPTTPTPGVLGGSITLSIQYRIVKY